MRVLSCCWGYCALKSAPQSELEREKAWSRIYLTPLLMAEADRDAVRRRQMAYAREAAIMRNVPGWKASGGGNGCDWTADESTGRVERVPPPEVKRGEE